MIYTFILKYSRFMGIEIILRYFRVLTK